MSDLKLYIIDGYMWIHRAYHASIRAGLTNSSGEPTGAVHVFTTSLLKLIREKQPDLLCVAMEGGGKTFRHELSGEYKANRTPPTDDFTIQRLRIEQILMAMNIPILRAAGYEADDIIGTVAKYAQKDRVVTYICSKDKDMLQLVDTYIKVFIAKTDEYFGVNDVVKKVGVLPSQFVDCLALMGDSSDNVLGVPGIGIKTAAKLINKYGTLENLLDHIDELKPKRATALREHEHRLALNKKLVTIDSKVDIDIDYYDYVLDENGYDKEELLKIFTELEFNQLVVQMEVEE